jgi:hypothetical protein
VARFSHSPRKSHGQAIKRIVQYLIETRTQGLVFTPDLTTGLDCFVDADFAGLYGHEDEQDPVSVKSRTGFVLTLYGCPVIWSSKLQAKITLSSTAAKYVAFSMAMRELLPMRVLLQELADKLGWLFRTEFRQLRQIPGNSGKSQIGTPADTEFALVIPGASAKYSVFFTGCTKLYQRYLRKSPTAYIYEESFRTPRRERTLQSSKPHLTISNECRCYDSNIIMRDYVGIGFC